MTRIAVERFGRIHVAANARGPAAFVRRKLFIPYGPSERLAAAFGRLIAEGVDEVEVAADGVPRSEAFEPTRIARAALAEPRAAGGWVQVDDYAGARRRAIVFLFGSRESDEPFVVAKVRSAGDGIPLSQERAALEAVASTVLRETVPVVRAYENRDGHEVLLLSTIGGVSMFREMNAAFLPRTHVKRHFEDAAAWLTAFQRARRGAHGDFWPRNILGGDGQTAVVDWENFDPREDPLVDVFHFPLTYALAYRWRSVRRSDTVGRFRQAFAHRNFVSDAVREWMAQFGAQHGLARADLQRKMIEWIARGAAGALTLPRFEPDQWNAMREIVEGRTQCVFS